MCLNCFKRPSAPDDDRNQSLWPLLSKLLSHILGLLHLSSVELLCRSSQVSFNLSRAGSTQAALTHQTSESRLWSSGWLKGHCDRCLGGKAGSSGASLACSTAPHGRQRSRAELTGLQHCPPLTARKQSQAKHPAPDMAHRPGRCKSNAQRKPDHS